MAPTNPKPQHGALYEKIAFRWIFDFNQKEPTLSILVFSVAYYSELRDVAIITINYYMYISSLVN